MKIEHYISQLLYRHQCVIVPNFGAFLTEIQSAHLNENSNSFYPPKKLISFNPHLKNNDGLLANHISLAEKRNYESAVAAIESEVIIWKSILEFSGKFTIKNVGELSLNAEKNIVFTPIDNTNYLMESFGLNSFISPSIKREIQLEIVDEVVVEEAAPIVFIAEERTSRPYLKYAAVLVLALSVAGTFGYKMYENRIAEQTLLVQTAVQKQVQNKIQEATFFIDNPIPAVRLTVKEEKLSYHVVAGAFRNERNAENIYQELIKLGYPARRVGTNRFGLHPVFFGSYATEIEAQQAMRAIHKTKSPEAWILVDEQ